MIKAISFDLDDTLWPVAPAIEKAEQALLDWFVEHAPNVANTGMDGLKAYRDKVWEQMPELAHDFSALRLHAIRSALKDHEYPEDLAHAGFAAFFAARNQVTLFKPVLPVLAELQKTYRLAALTNGNADIEEIGIGQFFDVHVRAAQVGAAKPDRQIFQHLISTLDLQPDQILHVGDSLEHDVAGAQAVGMPCVWLTAERDPARNLHQITCISELPQLLDQF